MAPDDTTLVNGHSTSPYRVSGSKRIKLAVSPPESTVIEAIEIASENDMAESISSEKDIYVDNRKLVDYGDYVEYVAFKNCIHCCETFESEARLMSHAPCIYARLALRSEENDTITFPNRKVTFYCELCDEGIKTLNLLRWHYIDVHFEARFECKKCTKAFKTKDLVQAHINEHHNSIDEIINDVAKAVGDDPTIEYDDSISIADTDEILRSPKLSWDEDEFDTSIVIEFEPENGEVSPDEVDLIQIHVPVSLSPKKKPKSLEAKPATLSLPESTATLASPSVAVAPISAEIKILEKIVETIDEKVMTTSPVKQPPPRVATTSIRKSVRKSVTKTNGSVSTSGEKKASKVSEVVNRKIMDVCKKLGFDTNVISIDSDSEASEVESTASTKHNEEDEIDYELGFEPNSDNGPSTNRINLTDPAVMKKYIEYADHLEKTEEMKCEHCERMFTNETNLAVHFPCYYLRLNVDAMKPENLKCDRCDWKTTSKTPSMHLLRCHYCKHFEAMFACKGCGVKFMRKRTVVAHFHAKHATNGN
ncbi:hypothetical protein HDE_09097 [Halotydeus destructor]|nr:hypothetical protein HDE_09097 [Halotydeus destructor]